MSQGEVTLSKYMDTIQTESKKGIDKFAQILTKFYFLLIELDEKMNGFVLNNQFLESIVIKDDMVLVKDFSNSLILPELSGDYRKDMEKIYGNIKKKLKISLEYHDNLDANI